jgi:hypothetical protein
MQKRLSCFALVISLMVALTGCGPIYNTEYSYIPPATDMGKMCVNQCITNKTLCQQMCQMRNDSCRTQSRQNALFDYQMYKHRQKANKQPITKDLSAFDRGGYECNSRCDCDFSFNQCYSACGGQVQEHKVCVMFCDKQ